MPDDRSNKHDFRPDPEIPLLHRCSQCGWGWKWDQDNNFTCPGQRLIFIAKGTPRA